MSAFTCKPTRRPATHPARDTDPAPFTRPWMKPSLPMSWLVTDGARRLRVGLRQLLPGFLQPPLIARRTHDAGRGPPRESGVTGHDHRENDRTECQRVLHIVPTRLQLEIALACAFGTMNDAHEPENANQGDPRLIRALVSAACRGYPASTVTLNSRRSRNAARSARNIRGRARPSRRAAASHIAEESARIGSPPARPSPSAAP